MLVELWCDGSEKKNKKRKRKRNYIVMSSDAYISPIVIQSSCLDITCKRVRIYAKLLSKVLGFN
jgi:hypothetical protein